MTPGSSPGAGDFTPGAWGGRHPLADELRVVHSGAWFAGLSRPLRDAILSRATVRHARHGQRVLSQGAPAAVWLCVVGGSLRLSTPRCGPRPAHPPRGAGRPAEPDLPEGHAATPGRQVVARLVPPGGWVGEVELCDGGAVLHDAYAQGDTRLLGVTGADFHLLDQRHREFGQALLRLQCARLRAMVEQAADRLTLSLEQRTARQLLHLEQAFGADAPAGPPIALPVSQSELGELVGASRQRTNGALKQLEREGAVRVAPSGVQIVARDVLMARAAAA